MKKKKKKKRQSHTELPENYLRYMSTINIRYTKGTICKNCFAFVLGAPGKSFGVVSSTSTGVDSQEEEVFRSRLGMLMGRGTRSLVLSHIAPLRLLFKN